MCATIARMSLAAVLFDNDGLTLDTEPAWTRAETTLFARHGSTFTTDHKRDLLGTAPADGGRQARARCSGVPGDELNAELHELVLEEVAAGVEPMPGAVDAAGRPARRRGAGRPGLELAARASSSAACAPPGWTAPSR